MSQQLVLFDIPSRDGTCWSFNPWKIRLALNYKKLPYTTEWLEYPDIKARLEPTGLDGDPEQVAPFTCPTLQFSDGSYVMNSRNIIKRLEAEYPDRPLKADSELTQVSLDLLTDIFDALAPVCLPEVPRKFLSERSADYFQATRKEHLGMTLDEFEAAKGGEQAREKASKPLDDAATLLKKTDGPFFHGDQVSYADFIFVGFLHFIKKLGGDHYERVVQRSDAFQKLYEACLPWLERDSH